MKDLQKRFKGFTPLKYNLTIRILLIIIPILLAVSVIDYMRFKSEMEAGFIHNQEQVQKTILHAIRMAESAYTIYSETLDDRMKEALEIFLSEYDQAGGNPDKIDLEALQEKIGGGMDLYIIDENNEVEFSTYKTDIGLDFNTYPEFAEYLDEIREKSSYSTQRISPEIRTGKLRKFAYMPTPDHRYILEVGLVSDQFAEFLEDLNYIKIAEELVADYPYLSRLRVFDMHGHLIGNPEEEVEPEIREIIANVVREKKSIEIPGRGKRIRISYLYVRARKEQYLTESTRVVEMAWNPGRIDRELRKKAMAHFAVSALAIIGSILITFYAAGRISRPIRKIVKDVDAIARGNLDHEITVDTRNELMILEHSINIMVNTIKEHMHQVELYSGRLEELVRERTGELEEANEELELFVFSVTHDLRAPLKKMENMARTLLERFTDKKNGEGRESAERILAEARRMDKLVTDLLSYSRMSRAEIEMETVNLREVVQNVISHLEALIREADATITVKGEFPSVTGHVLTLEQILSNLISNSIKYVKPGVKPEITIFAEERDGLFRIIVEDNGIGIDPKYQRKIFHLFERLHGVDEYPGTGIGLATVKKGIEKMNGRVGVKSEPGRGSRFWIELPAADETIE